MIKKNVFVFICVFFFVVNMQIFSQNPSGTSSNDAIKVRAASLPEGVSIHQLNNGMEVLLIENPVLPMTGVNVAVKIGSAYETFSTSGMSHMLEHLLFNGTTSRTQKELYDEVDLIGGYNNAHTSAYYTNYMMVTPAENIGKGMELQADMLFNSIVPEDKFEKEKGIVLEEISKSLASPQEQFERNATSVLYKGHALSLPTLGTYSTIESLLRDDVYTFYKNNYVPNNMILTAIGNFKTDEMLKQIKDIYGKAAPGLVKGEEYFNWNTGFQLLSQAIQKDFVYNRFYDGKDNALQLFYEIPSDKSPEFYGLLNLVLDKNSSDMQQLLKAEFPQIVKSFKVSTRLTPINNFIEAVILFENDNNLTEIVKSVTGKLVNLSYSLPDETIQSVETKERTDFLKNIEKPHMFGIYNSQQIIMNGFESILTSYSKGKYNDAAKELTEFKFSSQPVIIIQTPLEKSSEEKIETTKDIKLFTDENTGKYLIVSQNELSNLLAIHYLVKHKAYYENKYGKDAAQILHDCFGQRLNSDENQKVSSQFGFTFTVNDNPFIPMDDIYLHPDFGYIRVEGLADDLDGAVNFLNEQLNNFIPTEEEFEKAIEKFKNIEMMSMGGDKARKLFDKTYKEIINEPNPYSDTEVELTYENLISFTKEYFQPSNMIISVVSPASPGMVNELFNGLNFARPEVGLGVYTTSYKLQGEPVKIEKAGGSDRAYIFWGFINEINPDDTPALTALSLILSDKIVFDIREKQGMAYHMSAGINVIDDKALFYINQGTRPQNVDTLVAQYENFFSMNMIEDLPEEELEKSVNMYLGRMMFRRLSSINQAFYLGSSFYLDNNFNRDKEFLAQLKDVKLSDVKNAAAKYMKVNYPVLVIVR
ncbi:hypothetical protein ASZ90_004471 [hydrocarbon metagenome]|uniref:Insulinase family protein n=1 Tax=hydrocarbon metagenome TaxID=938273 RepID=A0A0W8FZN9_9ZZZZ